MPIPECNPTISKQRRFKHTCWHAHAGSHRSPWNDPRPQLLPNLLGHRHRLPIAHRLRDQVLLHRGRLPGDLARKRYVVQRRAQRHLRSHGGRTLRHGHRRLRKARPGVLHGGIVRIEHGAGKLQLGRAGAWRPCPHLDGHDVLEKQQHAAGFGLETL